MSIEQDSENKRIEDKLSILISLAKHVSSELHKAKCGLEERIEPLESRVDELSSMLEKLRCFITTTSSQKSVYLRPVDCILKEVKRVLKIALEVSKKTKHENPEIVEDLDTKISHLEWLISVYDPQNGSAICPIKMPTIKRSNIFVVWSGIAAIHMERELDDRVFATERLLSLAQGNYKNKKMIVTQGGLRALQNLLEENIPLQAQTVVINALCLLAEEQESLCRIMEKTIITTLERLSRTSPPSDQIEAANFVASIAELNPNLKEIDLIGKVIRRLITLLSPEPSGDHPTTSSHNQELRISCSKALWKLSLGSVSNCRTLTDTEGMIRLAKLMETTKEVELQYNCLMIIGETTAIAESDTLFRRRAYKNNSPNADAVVHGLLRIITESDDGKLRIPAIKSIGSLARSFSAKHTRVISHLVAMLGNPDQEVIVEAAIALQKFVCTENHLCSEHSNSMMDVNGVRLSKELLLNGDKRLQRHGLALICYLAKHGSNINLLIEAGAFTDLQTTGRLVADEHPELKEMLTDAIAKRSEVEAFGSPVKIMRLESSDSEDDSNRSLLNADADDESTACTDVTGHCTCHCRIM